MSKGKETKLMREIIIKINRHSKYETDKTEAKMLIPKWAPLAVLDTTRSDSPKNYGSWYCEHPMVGRSLAGPYYLLTGIQKGGWGPLEQQVFGHAPYIRHPVAFFLDPSESGGLKAPFLLLEEFDLNIPREHDWFGTGRFLFQYLRGNLYHSDVIWNFA